MLPSFRCQEWGHQSKEIGKKGMKRENEEANGSLLPSVFLVILIGDYDLIKP